MSRPARWKLAAIVSLAMAIAFVVVGGAIHGYSLASTAWLALSGLVFGAIAAPELEPKAFRFPALWQIAFSVAGCAALAAYLDAGPDGYLLAVLVGIALGVLAPYWIKHIQVP